MPASDARNKTTTTEGTGTKHLPSFPQSHLLLLPLLKKACHAGKKTHVHLSFSTPDIDRSRPERQRRLRRHKVNERGGAAFKCSVVRHSRQSKEWKRRERGEIGRSRNTCMPRPRQRWLAFKGGARRGIARARAAWHQTYTARRLNSRREVMRVEARRRWNAGTRS